MRAYDGSWLDKQRAGRRLFRVGLCLLALSVVMVGTIGAFQHPASGIACPGNSCTPTEGNWPTGAGLWAVIVVAVVGAVLTIAGFVPHRRAARK